MSGILNVACPLLAEMLLLFCGAFFASTETAYTSLSRITVRQMLRENARNARAVHQLRGNLDRLISTVLIGTNFITTLISALATAFSVTVLGPEYVTYGTALVSILVIIFSEIIPKTYAAIMPEAVAQASAPAIIVIQRALFPLVWVFDRLAGCVRLLEDRLVHTRRPLVTER